MKKSTKIILIASSIIGLSAIVYYFYESQRVKKLNEKVTTLEEALKRLEELKNK